MKSKLSLLKKIIISFLILFMGASSSLFAQYDAFFWCSEQGSPMGSSGIDITIDGVTVTSEFDGLALFEGLAVGDHDYTASKAGFVTQNGTISIVDQNVQEFVIMVPAVYDAFFWCSEQGSPMGMSGVDITIDGVTVTSEFDGLALFEGLAVGDYNYTASKSGYATQTGTISIIDQNIQEFIVMVPAVYDAFFWCSEQGSPMGMSGVDITIDGVTVTSEFDGLALFEGLASGNYNYTASKAGYETRTGNINIVDQNIEEFVIMEIGTYDMFFWCSAEGSPMGMSGVDVTINGVTITSDFDGLALFEGYEPGTYSYSVHKDGYYDQSGNVTISDQNIEQFIVLQPIISDVLFWVTDEVTDLPLENAMVTFNDALIYTDGNGLAWFSEVPYGTYEFTVSRDGYISEAGFVSVEASNWAENVSLAPYAFDIFFWCSEEGSPMGLSDVDVTIDGETLTSDFDGLVVFDYMIPGTYDFTASKDGYAVHTGQVTVIDENVQEFIVLQFVYDVTFMVDDGRGPLEGAEVQLNGMTQFTNEFGEATFTNLINGFYDFEITLEGYSAYEGNIEVNGEPLEVQISLIISGMNEQNFTDISIYPNPTKDYISISGLEQFEYYLYNQNGQLILRDKMESLMPKINLSDLPSGLYHLRLESDATIITEQILITK